MRNISRYIVLVQLYKFITKQKLKSQEHQHAILVNELKHEHLNEINRLKAEHEQQLKLIHQEHVEHV